MKISFIFFRALFYLICIYKVQAIFWSCLNRLEKGFNHPGRMSHSEGIRRDLSVWLSGHVARSEGVSKGGSWFGHSGHVAYSECIRRDFPGLGTRDTWHTQNASGGFFQREAFGTWGALEGCLGNVLPVGSLWTRGVPGMLPGRLSRLELSGRVAYPERSRGDYRLGSLGRAGLSGWAQVGCWING